MYNLGFLKKQIDIPEDALFRVHEGKGVELIYGCSLQPNSLNTLPDLKATLMTDLEYFFKIS